MFTPDTATAAWVLTGALSLCTLVFIPAIGFLLAREYRRRDNDSCETLKRIDKFGDMLEEVKKLAHETQLLVSEHRSWVNERFVSRPDYNRDIRTIRDDIRDIQNLHQANPGN